MPSALAIASSGGGRGRVRRLARWILGRSRRGRWRTGGAPRGVEAGPLAHLEIV